MTVSTRMTCLSHPDADGLLANYYSRQPLLQPTVLTAPAETGGGAAPILVTPGGTDALR
ncbi:MAG: hypothetical protein J07HX5_00926 [halophilic archaeon J07HX5]|nr:MAG: hypothetical protein J07HX5_00926 [halophilic archaeon J07HX5]